MGQALQKHNGEHDTWVSVQTEGSACCFTTVISHIEVFAMVNRKLMFPLASPASRPLHPPSGFLGHPADMLPTGKALCDPLCASPSSPSYCIYMWVFHSHWKLCSVSTSWTIRSSMSKIWPRLTQGYLILGVSPGAAGTLLCDLGCCIKYRM